MSVLADMPGLPTMVFLAALALTIGILLVRTQRYYSRNWSQRPSLEPLCRDSSQLINQLTPPSEVTQWEVQMHDTARRLLGELDSKIGILEELIREADRAAARLEAAQRSASGHAAHDQFQPLASPAIEDPYQPPVSQAEALRAAGSSGRDSAATPVGRETAGKRPPMERRYEQIYTLADYGYDPAEIARRTNTPVGEVQLILSLREGRG